MKLLETARVENFRIEKQSRLASLAWYTKKEGQSRLASLAWYSPSFLVVCVMMVAGAQSPEPVAILTDASNYIAARETVQFDMTMEMEFVDGERNVTASLTADIILGNTNKAKIHMKASEQEVVIYNNAKERHLFFPEKNTYRVLPAERDHQTLLRTVISGPLESSFSWLAAFLAGAEITYEEPPSLLYQMEFNGVQHNVLDMALPAYSVRAFLPDTTPALLYAFDLELRGEALSVYTKNPEGALRVKAKINNWKVDEPVTDDTFVFSPPPDAKPESSAAARPQSELVGKPAPDFTLPMLGGGTMTLSQHKDKDIVILDFWASWCGPCRQAMPIVVSVANRFKDQNVVLYAVNLRETADKAESFLKQNNLSVAVPMDTGEVAAKYEVSGIPRMVIIGKDGLIKAVHAGMSPALEQQLTEEITALLQ